MQIACKLQYMHLSQLHSELFDIQGVCRMSALRAVSTIVQQYTQCGGVANGSVLCVCVHQFTGALLSANVCWCCESLCRYYDDNTRLSVFLQIHLLRRLELFTFPGSGTGEGRGGEGRRQMCQQELLHVAEQHCQSSHILHRATSKALQTIENPYRDWKLPSTKCIYRRSGQFIQHPLITTHLSRVIRIL